MDMLGKKRVVIASESGGGYFSWLYAGTGGGTAPARPAEASISGGLGSRGHQGRSRGSPPAARKAGAILSTLV